MNLTIENKMNELNKYIVTTGKKRGASEVEVLSRSLRDVDVNIESGEISGVERKLMDEISIRTIVGKKTGNAFINMPTKDAADKALSMAIASAKASTDDDSWMGFPQPSTYPLIEGLWNEGIAISEPSVVVSIAREFMEKAVEAEEKAVELKPNYRAAFWKLAELYEKTGDQQKARQSYEAILKNINPSDEAALEKLKEL